MKYQVVRPFLDLGKTREAGDIIDVDDHRAAKLRRHGLIGKIETTQAPMPQEKAKVEPIETTIVEPIEKRTTKKVK